MGVLDSLETTSKDAFQSGEQYLETSKRYYELKFFKMMVLSSTNLAKGVLVGSFLFLGMLFLTIALAFFLGEAFNSLAYGFLMTAGIMLSLALLVFLLRKKLERPIIKKLSSTFFD